MVTKRGLGPRNDGSEPPRRIGSFELLEPYAADAVCREHLAVRADEQGAARPYVVRMARPLAAQTRSPRSPSRTPPESHRIARMAGLTSRRRPR